ncbi:unnamed protein product [Caenorhabditis auriculariae]|uniref:Uncharacterized protein n=1 Tax=Caenorhabditis auriculariae TaxID=2777116 RepID=A0A8S1HTC7_9PELO|nr:unnamed protein product [Caenorhabditis auriculariae]
MYRYEAAAKVLPKDLPAVPAKGEIDLTFAELLTLHGITTTTAEAARGNQLIRTLNIKHIYNAVTGQTLDHARLSVEGITPKNYLIAHDSGNLPLAQYLALRYGFKSLYADSPVIIFHPRKWCTLDECRGGDIGKLVKPPMSEDINKIVKSTIERNKAESFKTLRTDTVDHPEARYNSHRQQEQMEKIFYNNKFPDYPTRTTRLSFKKQEIVEKKDGSLFLCHEPQIQLLIRVLYDERHLSKAIYS